MKWDQHLRILMLIHVLTATHSILVKIHTQAAGRVERFNKRYGISKDQK